MLFWLPQFDFDGHFETLRQEVVEFLGRFLRFRCDGGEDDGAAHRFGREILAGRNGGRMRRGEAAAAEECSQAGAARGRSQIGRLGRSMRRAAVLFVRLRDPFFGGFQRGLDLAAEGWRQRTAAR